MFFFKKETRQVGIELITFYMGEFLQVSIYHWNVFRGNLLIFYFLRNIL